MGVVVVPKYTMPDATAVIAVTDPALLTLSTMLSVNVPLEAVVDCSVSVDDAAVPP